MRPGGRALSGLLLSLICVSSAGAGRLGDLGGFTRELMQEWKTPGLSVVAVRNGKTVFKDGFGVEKIGGRRRVGSNTLFPADSLSKTFTAVLGAMLVDEGLLKWNEPVRELLPDFRLQDPVATARCTLKDLLAHRSGLGRRDALWYRRGLKAQDLLTSLAFLKPKGAFRDRFDYSNLGYMLVGMMEEKTAGMSWDHLLSRRILQPLRMAGTQTSVPGRTEKFARPHLLGKDCQARAIGAMYEPALRAALGLWTSADDLEKWIRFLLEPSHRGLISDQVLETLWIPIVPMPEVSSPEIPMSAYGMGWIISSYRGRRILFHTGRGGGSSSILVLMPSESLGIAVLSNISNSRAPEILSWRIVDLLLELEAVDWKSRLWVEEEKLRDLEEKQRLQLQSLNNEGEAPEAGKALPDRLSGGFYENIAYGRLEIQRGEEGLSLHFRNFRAPLKLLEGSIYLAEIEDDPLWKQIALEFLPDASGVVLRLDGDSIVFSRVQTTKKAGPEGPPVHR